MTNNPAARLSVVAYKPKPGKESDLLALTREHTPYLQSIGLATARPQTIARAADGTLIEIFEWTEGGIEKAHTHEGLRALWTRYRELCDIVPLATLPETTQPFANFTPVS
jgi:hypothetical protein